MYFNLDKLFDGFNLTKKTLQKNKKFYKNIFKIQQLLTDLFNSAIAAQSGRCNQCKWEGATTTE